LPRSVRTSSRSFIPAIYEDAARMRWHRRHPLLHRALRRIVHSSLA
jgi:hypothetical protein